MLSERVDDIQEQTALGERIRSYPLLCGLDKAESAAILPLLREHEYADGDVILQQGEVSGRFHIIVSGETDVRVRREIEVSVARLTAGHFVGEMSCLTGESVSATVRAVESVRTVSMPREGLLRLMDISQSFRRHMLEAMVARVQDSNGRVVDEHTRSQVVARQLAEERESRLGQYVGNSPFMRQLREQIDKLARGDEPLWILGENGSGRYHAAYEIHKRSERAGQPIITVDGASFQLEAWRMNVQAAREATIVIRQADHLEYDVLSGLLEDVRRAGSRLILTAKERLDGLPGRELHLLPLRERTEDIPELVYEYLAREGVPEPQQAISQEALRMLAAYPYLRGNIEELGRIVVQALALSGGRSILGSHLRFGTRREPGERPKIGLALGSGSVRGAAHVGVMKVLEESDIPIDYIAGTSVGAFIGALYAGGQPIANFERVLPGVRWRQLVNFTMPPQAFADNQPMIRFVERFIGPVDFHELRIPFAAVASDANTGEAYIMNQGRVSHAVCASTAIPGVMKPVKLDGRLLIDGAVVHPVPVALCRSLGADIVIAVDVSAPPSKRRNPRNIIASILNTIDIMSDKIVQEELQMADVVLRPQLDIQEFTFKESAAFIRRGVEVTRAALDEIRRAIEEAG